MRNRKPGKPQFKDLDDLIDKWKKSGKTLEYFVNNVIKNSNWAYDLMRYFELKGEPERGQYLVIPPIHEQMSTVWIEEQIEKSIKNDWYYPQQFKEELALRKKYADKTLEELKRIRRWKPLTEEELTT